MKVLWLVSSPLRSSFNMTGKNLSGSWMDAAYNGCKGLDEFDMMIVCRKAGINESYSDGRHQMRLFSDNSFWCSLLEEYKPDIILLWGAEHPQYDEALKAYPDVPYIVYVQGVLSKIARDYSLGLPDGISRRFLSFHDIVRGTSMKAEKRGYEKLAERERVLLLNSAGVIVENDWTEDQVRAIKPDIRVFRSLLPIKDVFFQTDWSRTKVKEHVIFTTAGVGSPFKGHHFLIKALSLLKQRYPDVRLIIPGLNKIEDPFRCNSYERYIKSLIKEYQLSKNIEFLGPLSSEQMAHYNSTCHAFIMPSVVENHSSSLLEAMLVGAPCVASSVGGITHFGINRENVLLYDFPDVESIAGNVSRIFEDNKLADYLSENAKKLREVRRTNVGDDFLYCYKHILNK